MRSGLEKAICFLTRAKTFFPDFYEDLIIDHKTTTIIVHVYSRIFDEAGCILVHSKSIVVQGP
jgi:hypothetical protein